jgi:hypothetical protein
MILPTLNFPKFSFDSSNFFGIPDVLPEKTITIEKIKPFNFLLSSKIQDFGIHFFIHDYQFERLWLNPQRYINKLKRCDFVCSPDFSLYTDMPYSLQIYNTYRSRCLQRFWQEKGIKTITTISWSDYKSFDFCFLGVPLNQPVIISSMSANNYFFIIGLNEMIKKIQPSQIYCYGKEFKNDHNIIFIKPYFEDIVDGRKRKQQQR